MAGSTVGTARRDSTAIQQNPGLSVFLVLAKGCSHGSPEAWGREEGRQCRKTQHTGRQQPDSSKEKANAKESLGSVTMVCGCGKNCHKMDPGLSLCSRLYLLSQLITHRLHLVTNDVSGTISHRDTSRNPVFTVQALHACKTNERTGFAFMVL